MKLLIDQNISQRIIGLLDHRFGSVQHVRKLGLTDADDHAIFMFARNNSYDAIITIDDDFVKLLNLFSAPPKIIWIRTGNCSTSVLSEILIQRFDSLQNFLQSDEYFLCEVHKPA